ncbi:carbohydrate ABC transporter permease [Oceanobacillus neutriphilus]|uniref:Permease n=1 Tax=Oceanobacillus neutriphilus TaxID=531815 RepID=A0ABQ2NXE1_9BACI|nr:sugar ABC transporter permease [Oceanobacillus neutriphilus]GGP12926.1 permease [Oceanobacillus neutriphilus]
MEIVKSKPSSKLSMKRKIEKITPYLYLVPAVILVVIFCIYSDFFSLIVSFTEWDGLNEMQFIGFQNYIQMFQDPNFLLSSINTLIWVFGTLLIPVFIALLFAIAITHVKTQSFFKIVFYLPNALSQTIAGIILTTILSTYGLPHLLGVMGFESLAKDWLTVPYINTLIMVVSSGWQGIGLNLILFIVGLNQIPKEPIEAAIMEGAKGIRLYTKVVLPLLKPIMLIVLLMSLVNSFKSFDTIWVMTNGGPFRTSETLAVTMYKEAFVNNQLGYGSAIAMLLSVTVLIISWFLLRDTFKGEE